MTYLVAAVLLPLLCVPSALAASKLWTWFVTPLCGIPSPSLWVVVGLILLKAVVFGKYNFSDPNRSIEHRLEELKQRLSSWLAEPLIALLAGYLIKQFML